MDNSFGYHPSIKEPFSFNDVFHILMRKVYGWMFYALCITGLTALLVSSNDNIMVAILEHQYIMWGAIIIELALVVCLTFLIHRLTLAQAMMAFILYSAVNGITLSLVFLVYSTATIGITFLVTACTFGAMSVYGYFTKKDLSMVGRCCFFALIGIIIATIVNFFLGSTMMDYVISYIGVVVFMGLTAWDTQKIYKMLVHQDDVSEGTKKIALLGALTLYLDFVNLFLYLLKIFGRKNN